ncbi:hypothetical protein Plhal710r2_c009g0042511 [Plasmopara halstedii]
MAISTKKVDECDAVLAFLLGSTSSLHVKDAEKATSDNFNHLNDLQTQEHESKTVSINNWNDIVSRKFENPQTQATNSIVTKISQSAVTDKKQVSQHDKKNYKIKTTSNGSVKVHDNCAAEAEHEDDCAQSSCFNQKNENYSMVKDCFTVGCVVVVLVAYILACIYSYVSPLVVPLPDYKMLFTAYDTSNVSVIIVSPIDNSHMNPQGVFFEWKLVNFPTEALYLYGAEVFRYRLYLNDKLIKNELEFLALQDEDSGAIVLNRSVRFPIPIRKFIPDNNLTTSNRVFELHLQVDVPIPGLMEELKTYTQDVYVKQPFLVSHEEIYLKLTSPSDGATFKHHESIVLEYTAVNIQHMAIMIDDNIHLKKSYINDGNMLLRGLSVGLHKLEVRAFDDQKNVLVSSAIHVKIIDSD